MAKINEDLKDAKELMARINEDLKDAKELTNKISTYFNNFDPHTKEFAEMICNDHPTLQQNKFKMIMECIKIWADRYEKKHFDLRSEDTCRICSKMLKALDENDQYIRFI